MDSSSPTLKRYHQLLWSKQLPGGAKFTLDTTTPGVYLHHKSALGEFELSSDSIVHPYDYWERTRELIAQIPKADVDDFNRVGNTIGGYIIFPSNPVGNRQTINMARGGNPKINDRFDLTLESIRRHYNGEVSPWPTRLRGTRHFSPCSKTSLDTWTSSCFKTSFPATVT